MDVHKNARLTPAGRASLADRVAGGWPVKAATDAAGVSRRTAHKWLARHRPDHVIRQPAQPNC